MSLPGSTQAPATRHGETFLGQNLASRALRGEKESGEPRLTSVSHLSLKEAHSTGQGGWRRGKAVGSH